MFSCNLSSLTKFTADSVDQEFIQIHSSIALDRTVGIDLCGISLWFCLKLTLSHHSYNVERRFLRSFCKMGFIFSVWYAEFVS